MNHLYYIAFRAMGSEVSVQLETSADGNAVLNGVPHDIEQIEACLSRFRPASELMALNQHAGEWVSVSDILFDNIYHAKHASRLTNGLYNPLVLPAMLANGYDRSFDALMTPKMAPTTPVMDWQSIELRLKSHEVRLREGTAIDLGGIAKGWTASKLAHDLSVHGACLVNVGGDITACGAPHGLDCWQVEIEDPTNGTVFTTLALCDASIATSGIDYRHWYTDDGINRHHIIDPHTGLSANTDVLSATVIHTQAPMAEAFAKAVIIQGAEAGLAWLNNQWDAIGLVFRHDGTVLASSNFSQFMYPRITS